MHTQKLSARRTLVTLTLLAALCGVSSLPGGTPDAYDYSSPESFLHEIILELDANVGEDLNGDGAPDNSFGTLIWLLSGLLEFDVNQSLAETIDDASLAIGASWPGLGASTANLDPVTVHFFNLEYVDRNTLATDRFEVDRRSFVPGTSRPLIELTGTTDGSSQLDLQSDLFLLTIPFDGILLELEVHSARLRGELGLDASGVTVVNGSLAGAIPLANVFDALNALVAGSCPCVDGLLVDFENSRCAEVDDFSKCSDVDFCQNLVENCALALSLIPAGADVDLDGDKAADALSVIVHLQLRGTDLIGPAGPPLPPPVRPVFHRGDANHDGSVDIGDAISAFTFLFLGGDSPPCLESSDANNDGAIDISDGIGVLNYLFLGGVPPADPGPPRNDCGPDPDDLGSPGDLGCTGYEHC